MREIIYYVAISIDGFIAGPGGDISGFAQTGKGVDRYLADLQDFDTVIMGRKTYEFGYQYGLQPGERAYPHMKHYLFSSSLAFDPPSENVMICPLDIQTIMALKQKDGSPIYLCGGGEFAGWLLEHQLIDVLKIKLNPLILNEGTPLFGNAKQAYQLELTHQESFEDGLQIIRYKICYDEGESS